MTKRGIICSSLVTAAVLACVGLAPKANAAPLPETVYLFTYFHDNGQDGLHLAWSQDGLQWDALNGDKPLLAPKVGDGKLMRDPCVTRGPDGTFHMVWTDSWDSRTIGYASTIDFIHWSEQKEIPVMTNEPSAQNCWAPEIIHDDQRSCFMIFWATTLPDRFGETWFGGRNDSNHRIYVTTTKDFKYFTPAEVFLDPGFNCIDSTLFSNSGRVYMIFKDETRTPQVMKNLRMAVAPKWAGPFQVDPKPINPPGAWVEGPTVLTVGKDIYLYYDEYTKHRYGALRTRDLTSWEDVTDQLTTPRGMSHGTAFPVCREVVKPLLEMNTDQASLSR